MKTKIYLLAVLMLGAASCVNSKKLADKTIRNEKAFQIVGKEYILRHGSIIDTPEVRYLPGKPVVSVIQRIDTVKQPVPCDSFEVTTPSGRTVKVDGGGKLVVSGADTVYQQVDTAVYTIIDRTQYEIAMDSLNYYRAEHQTLNGTISDLRNSMRTVRMLVIFAGLGILGAGIWFALRR